MSDENDRQTNQDNIVSIDFRKRAQHRDQSRAGGGETPPTSTTEGAGTSAREGAFPGKLYWLYCPTCGTVEYTEVPMPGGRTHNMCGTLVEEAEVDLDFRAELSLADINLERLRMFEQVIQKQRAHFEEYRKRIMLAAGRNLDAYPPGHPEREALNTAPLDDFGLTVSRFFQVPGTRFAPKTPTPDDKPTD